MRAILVIAVLLYVAVRALMVAALGDVYFYGEELEKGAVAHFLLAGVDVPHAKLPFHPYEGGGFVASHVKALCFLLVGENVLAHKIAALLWGGLLVAATVGLAFRHAGRGAAIVIALLLALGPAQFQKQSLLHLGIHYEALLFMALVLDLGLRVAVTPRGEKPSTRLLVGLGLAAGFGTYFSYQVPVAVLAVIVLLAATEWRRIFAPPLVVGTLVGLLPLALMALAVGGDVLDIHGSDVGEGGGWARFRDALAVGLSGTAARAELALGAIAIGFGLYASPPAGDRRTALVLVAGFALLWTIGAIASGMIPRVGSDPHWVRFIRFAPLVFALLMLLSLAVGPAVDLAFAGARRRSAVVARVAVVALVALGGTFALRAIEAGNIRNVGGNLARLTGTSGIELRGALIKIVPRLEDTSDEDRAGRAARAVAPFGALDDPRTSFLAAELAAGAAHFVGGVTPDEILDALEAALPDRFTRDDLAGGIGGVVLRSIGGDVRGALSDPDFDPRLAEALGRYGDGFLSLEPYLGAELDVPRGTPLELPFVRGFGRRVFRCSVMQAYWGWELRLRPMRARGRVEQSARAAGASDEVVAALLEGFDSAARDFGVDGTTLPR